MQLAKMQPALATLGIKALGIMSADEDRARVYFKLRPIALPLAVDPDRRVHRAFGVPYMSLVPEKSGSETHWPHSATPEEFGRVMVDGLGDLATAMSVPQARDELNRRDGFQLTDDDRRQRAEGHQLLGLFLIDRDGMVRWNWVEAMAGRHTTGSFPAESEIMKAAGALT